jgi:hypothetical protein
MFEAMALEADEGLTLTAYSAQPGTPSHDGLKLLASWAATRHADDSQSHRSDTGSVCTGSGKPGSWTASGLVGEEVGRVVAVHPSAPASRGTTIPVT